ncbi:MAG: hypothetical protein IZT59_09420 [Verrucomicrobia bacterium]|jgi:hypothetical protein|nr:hypothetical protein [Verrucomicrobiota bacterium]|tara:strand:- start:27325 stop:27519 length:195 start_codon:yes stop_codon:yes gene_type:complete
MSIRNFIGVSSALLLAWLGATYFHEIPAERYPKQGKFSSQTSAKNSSVSDDAVASATTPETENR